MLKKKSERYGLIVSTIGNILMWYNFALFMPFLHILSKQFFPIDNIALCSVISFLALSMGLFFRPVGAAIFGPIGDKIGRGKAISLSILMMAIPTLCIGFIPSYSQIGILSPILLVFCRILQGISLGGGYTSAMVNLVELAPSNRRGFFGSWTDVGSQIGVLFSGQLLVILHLFFSESEIYSFAWRYPFIFSIILIPFAFIIPNKTEEPKSNNDSSQKGIIKMLSECKKEVICTMAITSFSAAGFYTLLTFFPYYLVREKILTLKEATVCCSFANATVILAALGCGFLSDYFSRKIFLRSGMIGVTIVVYLIFLTGGHSVTTWIIMHSLYGLFLGMYFGSRAAFFSEAFPKHIRCTGVSISLSLAQAVVGGSTSVIMNYCTSVSAFFSIIPVTVVLVMGMIALTQIEDRTGKDLL